MKRWAAAGPRARRPWARRIIRLNPRAARVEERAVIGNLHRALLRVLVAVVVLVPTGTVVAQQAGAASPAVDCPAATGPPLRDLADALGKDLGTAYRPQYEAGDPCYRQVAGREFTTLTPEIATFPSGVAPTPGPRNFAAADEVCDTATAHGQTCQVHSVVWDPVDHPEWGIVPQWIRDLDPVARRAEMVQLVTDVGEHFDGRIGTWTVVNEAFRADGTLWDSTWNTDSDDSYIFDAFRAARLAAPQAELLYNDFGAEDVNAKSDAILDLVTRLAAEQVEVTVDGVPVLRPLIDGVGLQAHFGVGPGQAPDLASVAANIERLADAGLDVRITELDVRVPVVDGQVAASDEDRQRELYRDTVAVCVAAESCRGVTLWGFTDRHSWITEHPATFSGEGAAHPFDLDYAAKPALDGIRDALGAGVDPGYVPLEPARLADTRPGRSTIDGRSAGGGPVGRGAPLTLEVAGRGGVAASDVASVVLNVAVVAPRTEGYVTAHPAGGPVPTASNLNFGAGRTVSTLVVVGVGTGGSVTLSTSSPSIHLVVDVAGYFAESSGFEPVAPARLADTRPGRPTVDGLHAGSGPATPGAPLVLDVLGRAGVPAAGVTAVVLNVAVTAPSSEGFVTVHPTGEPRPAASNLNVARGGTVANTVIAKLGADGRVTLYASPRSAHLVVDVAAWVGPDSGLVASTPRRFADTRPGRATVDGGFRGSGRVGSAVPGRSRIDVRVTGRGGVPSGARAVVLNVTAVSPSAGGHLTVFPVGSARPNAANLNFDRGATVSNLVIAKVRADGYVSVHVAAPATDVVIDVQGHVL